MLSGKRSAGIQSSDSHLWDSALTKSPDHFLTSKKSDSLPERCADDVLAFLRRRFGAP